MASAKRFKIAQCFKITEPSASKPPKYFKIAKVLQNHVGQALQKRLAHQNRLALQHCMGMTLLKLASKSRSECVSPYTGLCSTSLCATRSEHGKHTCLLHDAALEPIPTDHTSAMHECIQLIKSTSTCSCISLLRRRLWLDFVFASQAKVRRLLVLGLGAFLEYYFSAQSFTPQALRSATTGTPTSASASTIMKHGQVATGTATSASTIMKIGRACT